jgi:hypothetical protein
VDPPNPIPTLLVKGLPIIHSNLLGSDGIDPKYTYVRGM